MDERRQETHQGGFVHPDFRPHALREQKLPPNEAVAVLVSVLSAVWIILFGPFSSPEIAGWILVGAAAALIPAIWLTLRNPKVIWREIKPRILPLKRADMRKLYSSSPNLGVLPNLPRIHDGCSQTTFARQSLRLLVRSENSPR